MSLIEIQPYDKDWPRLFEEEKRIILEKTAPWVVALEHVGSTSIPGIPAKPTIDMCLVVNSLNVADEHIIAKLIDLGYEYLQHLEEHIPDRRYCQRLDSNKKHLIHIHIVEKDSKRHTDYLLFRDYLIAHPDEMRRYANLKLKLSKEFSAYREAYTNHKADFIQEILRKAKEWKTLNDNGELCQ